MADPRPVRHDDAAFSAPVFGRTLPQWATPPCRENLRTQWETTQAAQFTSDVDEYAYTAALDEASDRVRVVEIGRTRLGRPINMFIIGYPKASPSVRAISNGPAALVTATCTATSRRRARRA